MRRLRCWALVSIVVIWGGCCALASLSGSWMMIATLGPISPPELALDSTLTVTYAIAGMRVASVSAFSSTGWSGQQLTFNGDFGALDLDSQLKFDPALVSFDQWKTTVGWSDRGVAFSTVFDLTSTGRALTISGSGESGELKIEGSVQLGSNDEDCPLLFQSMSFSIGSPMQCGDLSSSLSFNCGGFSSANVSLAGIEVTGLPWLALTAKLTYTVGDKRLTLSPSVDLIEAVCFEVLSEVVFGGNLSATAFNIYGLGFSFESGSVSVEALSYLDDAHVFEGEYWERLSIAYNERGCCGSVGGRVEWLFLEGGMRLFDVARLRAETTVGLSPQTRVTGSLDFDLETSVCEEMSILFSVSW